MQTPDWTSPGIATLRKLEMKLDCVHRTRAVKGPLTAEAVSKRLRINLRESIQNTAVAAYV